MAIDIVFETHRWSDDNERGRASGWLPGALTARGRAEARERGRARHDNGIAAVFTSDLTRAVQTAEIAFGETGVPILHDWRLRECDYGACNGDPAEHVHAERAQHLDVPYPGGESWRQAVERAGRVLHDLPTRWDGCRVLVIGHVATRWALDHFVDGVALEDLVVADFGWRAEGWEYRLAGSLGP
jgi:alpha-ribazole phosphatase/probable phosphoglycerate mutase